MPYKDRSLPIKLLLIEDDSDDAFLIKKVLSQIRRMPIETAHSNSLSGALQYLKDHNIDIIMTDLGLPDSLGIDTVASILKKVSDIPVVVLTGIDDEDLAVEAVRSGAQDYLVKGRIDDNLLSRCIRYSMERNILLRKLKTESVTDELTGLYNRRAKRILGTSFLIV